MQPLIQDVAEINKKEKGPLQSRALQIEFASRKLQLFADN